MDVQTVKDRLRDSRKALFDAYGIERMAIFGSVARGEATDASDIDLLIEFNQPIGLRFVDLAELLESLLEAPVDLVSKGGIKPRYWAAIEGELVYVQFDNVVEMARRDSTLLISDMLDAANRIPMEVQEANAEIPWRPLVGMRHRIVHEYFGIDLGIVWSIVSSDLSPQIVQLQSVLCAEEE